MEAEDNSHRIFVALGAAVALLASCSEPKEKVEPEPAGLTATPATETPPTETPSGEWACPPSTLGARMVLIPVDEGKPYCIDEREGTYGEYKEFLAAKGADFSGQPPECDWNDDYGPVSSEVPAWSAEGIPVNYGPPIEDADPDRAVQGVDFCDAWAFCSWAGKRLCGLRGAPPGKVTTVDLVVNPETGERSHAEPVHTVKNEWFNVCSQGGTTKYPYGDELRPGACFDDTQYAAKGEGAWKVRDVAGNDCHGTQPPYDKVFNMSGTSTWVNICSTYSCPTMGSLGGYEQQQCTGNGAMTPQELHSGVRCCADAGTGVGPWP